MAKKVAISSLNASTIDILNTIRANAPLDYQNLVPEVTDSTQIPRVGDMLVGYPSLANHFLSALMNRIALVSVKSATFNNAYAKLKKGYLEFGETVEEVFVGIAKAREFSAEKAEKREFKRTLPDVRTAFHVMNWQVQYPVTIQQQDLRQAFMSVDGVRDLIAKIINSVYTASEYDEFLLFKYLMIKAIAKGQMYNKVFKGSDIKNAGTVFRGMSNKLTFMSNKYNADGVTTSTPKSQQYIFMDAEFNAKYDVEVLASAFNMDKAEFMGKLMLIDDWTTFDNERFDVIRAESDMIEEVTEEELSLMNKVKAVLVDEEWFQVYDNTIQFTETPVASGMYWNYFLNVWKTVSSSPFSNAVAFFEQENGEQVFELLPRTIDFHNDVIETNDAYIVSLVLNRVLNDNDEECGVDNTKIKFIQTEELTELGVAVKNYGVFMWNKNQGPETIFELVFEYDGKEYTCNTDPGEFIAPENTFTFR